MNNEDHFEFDEDSLPSKTQLKKESQQLQELGDQLTQLNETQMLELQLDDALLDAVKIAKKMKASNSRRRQIQFIGKLIRNRDPEALIQAFEQLTQEKENHVQVHHLCENWRDRLLEDMNELQAFLDQYPNADRQQLRQLIRNAQNEKKANKPPASARKLYTLIKSVVG
ncbi:ribosome biogenesis factor YjgA [Sessilibacter corallicola]|uniref:Dual-action ribosomal maturation protein DarP n=1 Tax=Sessilibacter corallicola TaxID=2904075 RepID=A0ABQ0A3J0_9GAMM|nr:ribosome biogenesis factor YjgA [Sessilibacter corallicola]MCE2027156.1 DUF615 domain-containing protein [Sessilibacter corallicola]